MGTRTTLAAIATHWCSQASRERKGERERDDEALATDWPAGRSGTADTFGSPPDQCAC